MKISNRDLKILLIFLGVLMVIAAYFFGFRPLQEKNEGIIQEITTLRAELNELQVLAAKEEYYQTNIEKMETEVEEIFAQFPADIKTEDCIMYAQELEMVTVADIESITFTSNQLAYAWGRGAVNDKGEFETAASTEGAEEDTSSNEAAQETDQGDAAANTAETIDEAAQTTSVGDNNKELFVTNISLTYNSTYKALKELISYIHNNQNRRTLHTMNVSYDTETGNLTGSVELGMYSLTGLNKAYEAPAIPSMTIGTDNIFGTVEVPSNTQEQEEPQEQEEQIEENAEESTEENTEENTQN